MSDLEQDGHSPIAGAFADEWHMIQSARSAIDHNNYTADCVPSSHINDTWGYIIASNGSSYSRSTPSDSGTSLNNNGGHFNNYLKEEDNFSGYAASFAPSAPVNIPGLVPETSSPSTTYEPSLPVSPREVFNDDQAYFSSSPSPDEYSLGEGSQSPFESYTAAYNTPDETNPLDLHPRVDHAQYGQTRNYGLGLEQGWGTHPVAEVQPQYGTTQSQWGWNYPASVRGFGGYDDMSQTMGIPQVIDGMGEDTLHSDRCDDPFLETQDQEGRDEQNMFLIQCRRSGMSYREIREQGNFREAESTLRGRFRDLTKPKQERVRKPVWRSRDIGLLNDAVNSMIGASERHHGSTRTRRPTDIDISKVSWKRVSAYIAENGGSYHFAYATCKKKWKQIHGVL
ncbi:hypothetical protein NA57DRAFT_79223 [Rhizodiscina lignyota]|uniref:Myb-like domain-containing protein n=1 Tax=Rhizodiscina lignyota TaxID=1504668 RepID=A0A9P4M3A6_9PEZI|nr:hypothetical protein NA57DRAFT_79223 [Rhizodiscina lignyota]